MASLSMCRLDQFSSECTTHYKLAFFSPSSLSFSSLCLVLDPGIFLLLSSPVFSCLVVAAAGDMDDADGGRARDRLIPWIPNEPFVDIEPIALRVKALPVKSLLAEGNSRAEALKASLSLRTQLRRHILEGDIARATELLQAEVNDGRRVWVIDNGTSISMVCDGV